MLRIDDKDIIHRVFYFVPDMGKTYMYEMRLGSIYIASAVEANLRNADEQERLKLYRRLQSMYEMRLRSIYFASAVGANLKKTDEQERLKLFRWLQSHDQSRSTAGWLFENYCYGVLSPGINAVARLLTDGAHDLQLEMSPGYHRIAELESIEEMFRNMYSAPDIPNLPTVGYYIDTIKRMIYLFQMTVSRDHSISLENLTYAMKKFELNKHGLPFALVFVVPSNIANDFPKQKITGAHSFDDLKNRSVDKIRGIGTITAMQLRCLKISTQHDFYVAAQDPSRLEPMTGFIKKTYISNFVEIVDGIKQYEELINIPQFVLGIDVE